jgi:hypothetical protein
MASASLTVYLRDMDEFVALAKAAYAVIDTAPRSPEVEHLREALITVAGLMAEGKEREN